IPEPVAPARTHKLGESIEVRDPSALPKNIPAGTEWTLTNSYETMPPRYEYKLATKRNEQPTVKIGDSIEVGDPSELPKSIPAGTEWTLTNSYETMPPRYEYKLATKRSEQPSCRRGDSVTVGDPSELPKNIPAGTEWKCTQSFETMPPRYEYELV
ncbi:MAG: hypothetical protein HY901_25380, partial [Deltaproteobacteria bacterium]|nr:hypothetical protein [Deltaproteobacteria bacterium]